MKVQEAIEILKGMQSPLQDYADMVGAPAWAYGCRYVYPEPEDYAIEEAITALKEKQNRRWIRVTERMPEAAELEAYGDEVTPVLITYLGYYDGEPNADALAIWCEDNTWRWYDEALHVNIMDVAKVEITAWMPLPESYRPE